MNCTAAQNDILLKDSGELSQESMDGLTKHLETCSACREFSRSLSIVTSTAKYALSDEGPHPSVGVNIRRAAEQHKKNPVIPFPVRRVRLAAIAALLVIMLGITWLVLPRQQDASSVNEFGAFMAMVTESESDGDMSLTQVEQSHSLEAIAQQLLEMEGFAVDDLFESEEEATLFELPYPTTTQYRRTLELPDQKCG